MNRRKEAKMKQRNLRTFFRGIFFGIIVLMMTAGFTQAEVWRMATKLPAESPAGRSFRYFADKVKEYSGGKLTVDVFPSEQLGKTAAALEQLQAGVIHLYPEGPDYLNKWAPEMAYVFAPFLYDSRDHWLRFMKSDLVKGWLGNVEKKAGITVLGDITAFLRGPYRVMSTKRQVKTLADMRGLKIRMFPNDLVVNAYTHLGTEVRVLGWTEVYESLSRGIVEAVTLPISLVEAMKFYEVAPYVVRIDEFHQSVAFMTNAKAYRGLSPELRQAVDRAYADAAKYVTDLTNKSTEEMIERLKKKGITFSRINTAEFVQRMLEFYQAQEKAGKLPSGFMATVAASR
jgi:TRAP-type C4-dicarboxylate transport system substrate-binding protein